MNAETYYLDSSQEEAEVQRLDVQHQIWRLLLEGRLITTPRERLEKVLDLGCGSAVWTAAVARSNSTTRVVGVDITPPLNDFGLNNLTIVKGNVEEPWSFVEDDGCKLFDLITARVLVAAIQNWPKLIERCFEHLHPGGWVEIHDVNIGTFSESFSWQDESSALMRWYQCFRKAAAEYGFDGFANRKRVEMLKHAGFTNVSEQFFKCYLDPDAVDDPKDKAIAGLTRRNMLGLLDAVTKTMQERAQWHILGVNSSELTMLKDAARADVIEYSAHRRYYWTYSVHCGQKRSLDSNSLDK